ncbi:NAD(P)H-dependent oxidoreductase [Pseudorhodobacter ferrugineus]|uniref:NAD(P)H-dependent oxidoreductase n=1 Tax=Pseudorhodobacter ferrugineus TaxID=77008 RepID=UPI000B24884B|nr:NAD(P)H-dependent oxidoreductase [Pseudorhodobacter ferrugineus]
MKALVVIGHPAPNSFNHALAARIVTAWEQLGAKVVVRDLAVETFDPRLTPEEARGAPTTDPLVRRHIADLASADLLAVVHPVMWGMPPAILKGWIDRVFALNVAYGFPQGTAKGPTRLACCPCARP